MASDRSSDVESLESLRSEAEQLQAKLNEERNKLNDAESKIVTNITAVLYLILV